MSVLGNSVDCTGRFRFDLPKARGYAGSPCPRGWQGLWRYSAGYSAPGRRRLGHCSRAGAPADPLSARQVEVRFDHWKAVAGLRRSITLHSFRAGIATQLHETTGDPCLVSRALGHKDLRSTLRYVRVSTAAVRDAMEVAFG